MIIYSKLSVKSNLEKDAHFVYGTGILVSFFSRRCRFTLQNIKTFSFMTIIFNILISYFMNFETEIGK